MARELVRDGNRRLVGMVWLVWGLRWRTRDTGYFGMFSDPEFGSCFDSSGRLDERNGFG